MKKYNQSLKIKEELGNKSGIAITLGQMGRIYEEEEEYELALRAYSTAFEIFDQLRSPYIELARKDIKRLKGKMDKKRQSGRNKKKWWKIFKNCLEKVRDER
ncbi:hypothetical protein FXW07_00340 [Methanosarcina sp. DH1]|nr:hypothetical protein [Methanosarcina sp. DH1]